MKQKTLRINHQINASTVRLVDGAGAHLGIMPILQARRMAEEQAVDLIEISPNADPPTCRLMDYGKFLYQQKKAKQEIRRRAVVQVIKELQLRPMTAPHDLETKLNQARKFLQDGDKVKFTVRFSGRELAHPEIAHRMLDGILQKLSDIAKLETKSRIESKQLQVVLAPA